MIFNNLIEECSKIFLRKPEKKIFIMKAASVLLGCSGFSLLLVAALYSAALAKQFYASELGTQTLFTGKGQFDVDQIRYELGGCIYAAFCVSFIGEKLLNNDSLMHLQSHSQSIK